MKHFNLILLVIYSCLLTAFTHAQNIGINSDGSLPDASAILDIKSTDKGMLVPRMTTSQRDNITNPATGLMVYDSDTETFWYHNDVEWVEIGNTNNLSTNLSKIEYLTSNNQLITVDNASYIQIHSNFFSSPQRVFTLTSGMRIGQILILEEIAGHSRIANTGNTKLISNYFDLTNNDTVVLLWNGTFWKELSRSSILN